MNIHVIESLNLTQTQRSRLDKLGKVIYFDGVPDEDEVIKRSENADILAADWSPIDLAIPKMKKGVKLISLPFTGVGFLPLDEAAKKGIKIANAPGYSTESVAEFGIGLMISLVRKIYLYVKNEPKPESTFTLHGRTLVILGAGNIGEAVGDIAKSLGMKIIIWRRGDNLIKVLKQADVLYCALPFSEETKGLLGEKEFNSLKQGSYFVTTSHNQIYDHTALLKVLDKNLNGAAIDLEGTNTGDYKSEAYIKLKNHSKILLTPHIAYKTDYSTKRGHDIMVDNIEAFIKGKPINIVN
ncbi:MAG: NAD(P)-dependent oxidoreductase [Nanoarchaeota archaeon]|nr:NAD(P)-dependent oxidoreductase [Nanoarchaeota archaeon]